MAASAGSLRAGEAGDLPTAPKRHRIRPDDDLGGGVGRSDSEHCAPRITPGKLISGLRPTYGAALEPTLNTAFMWGSPCEGERGPGPAPDRRSQRPNRDARCSWGGRRRTLEAMPAGCLMTRPSLGPEHPVPACFFSRIAARVASRLLGELPHDPAPT